MAQHKSPNSLESVVKPARFFPSFQAIIKTQIIRSLKRNNHLPYAQYCNIRLNNRQTQCFSPGLSDVIDFAMLPIRRCHVKNPCKFRNFQIIRKWFLKHYRAQISFLFEPLNEKIQLQFKNFKIYKDLYRKPLKHDWVARVVFLIQIPLIFGNCCNHYFWGIPLKIYRLPVLNFNMPC